MPRSIIKFRSEKSFKKVKTQTLTTKNIILVRIRGANFTHITSMEMRFFFGILKDICDVSNVLATSSV